MVNDANIPQDEPKLPDPFEIVSIHAVAAPPGTAGENWRRYEISQGDNRIVGYRAGAGATVREAVCGELPVTRRRVADRGLDNACSMDSRPA